MSDIFDIKNATVGTQIFDTKGAKNICYGKHNVFDITCNLEGNLSDTAKQYPSSNNSIMSEFAFYAVYNIKLSQERFLGYNPQEDVFYIGFDCKAKINKEKEAFFDDVRETVGEKHLEEFYDDVKEVKASTLLTAIYEKGKWSIVEEEHVLEASFDEYFLSIVQPQSIIIRTK